MAKNLFEDHEDASAVATEVIRSRRLLRSSENTFLLLNALLFPHSKTKNEDWRLIKEAVGNDTMEREQITVDKFASTLYLPLIK